LRVVLPRRCWCPKPSFVGERAIVAEEAWLAKTRGAIARASSSRASSSRARPAPSELRSIDALRDEVACASGADLAPRLHEMSARQALLARPAEAPGPTRRRRTSRTSASACRASRRTTRSASRGATRRCARSTRGPKVPGRVFGRLPRLAAETPGLVVSSKRDPALRSARASPPSRAASPRLRGRLVAPFTERSVLRARVDASEGTLPRAAIDETV
jgi:hypothetical protein